MSKTSRRKFTTEFKSKVCLEAIKEQQTIEALSKKHDLHPTQINAWKKEFLEKAATVFDKEGSTTTASGRNNLIRWPALASFLSPLTPWWRKYFLNRLRFKATLSGLNHKTKTTFLAPKRFLYLPYQPKTRFL